MVWPYAQRRPPRLPTFLVIGAAKAGTTSLHDYLGQHPDVFMSQPKEPKFFAFEDSPPMYRGPDDEPDSGLAPSRVLDFSKYRHAITTLPEYQAIFRDVRQERAIGESTVVYLYHPAAPDRILRHLPDVRLVAVLRHPADRAYSHFCHLRSKGNEPLDFTAALEAEDGRIRRNWAPPWHYFRRGFYGEQLARYYARFPADHIRVFLFEELQADPLRLVQDIFRFVGVDAEFVPDLRERHLVTMGSARVPRWKWLDHLLNRPNVWKSAAKGLLRSRRMRRKLRRGLLDWLGERQEVRHPGPIDPDIRAALTERYRSDILLLQSLIGRDLSHWLEPRGVSHSAQAVAPEAG